MTSAARLVRTSRRAAGLTQSDLASRAHDHQPAISAIESGLRDAGIGLVQKLLHATDHTVIALPTSSRPVNEAADAIYVALRNGDSELALREVVQLSDDLQRESGSIRVALTACPPPSTGDHRFDALVASVVDYWLAQEQLPRAQWLLKPDLFLTQPWFIDDLTELHQHAKESTDQAFSARNVFVDIAFLASV